MAVRKSAWEEARDWLGGTASKVSSRVSDTFKPVKERAQTFLQRDFSRDYNNYIKAQKAKDQARQGRVNLMTRKILEQPVQSRVSLRSPFAQTTEPIKIRSATLKTPSRISPKITSFLQKARDFVPIKAVAEGFERVKETPLKEYFLPTSSAESPTKARKFVAKTGVSFVDMLATAVDFSVTMQQRNLAGGPLTSNRKLRNSWLEYYKKELDSGEVMPTRKVKRAIDKLEQVEYLQPSQEWTNASLEEKFTQRLPETVLNIGPSLVSSIGSYAINPVFGLWMTVAGTAGDIKDDAMDNGVEETPAELLGLGAGLLIGALDRIVPDEVFGGPAVKKQFTRSFVQKLTRWGLLTSKETGTEITQEGVQMLAESTFREVGLDEIKTRIAMAGFGGFLGGGGMGSIQIATDYANNTVSKDILGKRLLEAIQSEEGFFRIPGKDQSVKVAELPQNLKGAKPRYGYRDNLYTLQFESDIDKALYVVAQTKKSKSDEAYMQFLEGVFPYKRRAQIRLMGINIKNNVIKPRAKEGTGGDLTIENQDSTLNEFEKSTAREKAREGEETKIVHSGKRTLDQVRKEGVIGSKNGIFGKGVYFADPISESLQEFGSQESDTTYQIDKNDFNLITLDTKAKEEAFIKNFNLEPKSKNLVKALLKTGQFDGAVITNPDKKVGNTYVISNLTKLNETLSDTSKQTTPTDTSLPIKPDITQPSVEKPTTSKQSDQLTAKQKKAQEKALSQRAEKVVPAGEKERSHIKRLKELENTPQFIKEMATGTYIPRSQDQYQKEALQFFKTNLDAAENAAYNAKTDTEISMARMLADYYGSIGEFTKAQDLTANTDRAGTSLGQAVNAFKDWNNMDPEGAFTYALAKIAKYNKKNPKKPLKVNDAELKAVFDEANRIRKLPLGRERDLATAKLREQIRNLIPSSVLDKGITVWKAGLLTSLRTHERNLIGTTLMTGGEIAKDVPAAIVDRLLSLRTGKHSLTLTTRGLREGFSKKTLTQVTDAIRYGYDPNTLIHKYNPNHITWGKGWLEQGLKIATEAAYRPLAAEDTAFFNATYARSLYDQVMTQARNDGKSGNAKYIKDLFNDPTSQMKIVAVNEARYSTYHDKTTLGKAAQRLKRTLSKKQIGQLVAEGLIPFTEVPASIGSHMVDYSPIGLMKGIKNVGEVAIYNVPELQRKASHDFGRGLIGTAIFTLGAYLFRKGLLIGKPEDEKERKQWELENKQDNSLFIGKWRSLNNISPHTLILLAGAKYQEEMDKRETEGTSTAEALAFAGLQMLDDYFELSLLQGIQEPYAVVRDPKRYKPSRYAGRLASSFVPNLIKDTAKAGDLYQRESNKFQDYLTNAIPGLRNQNIVKRDVFGNPMIQTPTGYRAYIDMFNSKTPMNQDDPAVIELSRLNDVGENATPSKLTKNQTINGEKMTLTPEQLDRLEQEIGPRQHAAITALIQTPDYLAASDADKKKMMTNTYTKVRNNVRKYIDLSTPDLSDEALKDSFEAILTGGVKPVPEGLSEAVTKKQKRANEFEYAQNLLEKKDQIPDGEAFFQSQLESLDISKADLLYDRKTRLEPDELQLDEIKAEISELQGEDLLTSLIAMRIVSEGSRKALLTDTLITKLEKDGTLSEDEADFLKTIMWDTETQSFTRKLDKGKGKKPKKSPTITVKTPKLPSLSLEKLGPTASNFKPVKIRTLDTGRIRRELPTYNPLNISETGEFTPRKISLNIRKPVTNLAGLGKIR